MYVDRLGSRMSTDVILLNERYELASNVVGLLYSVAM